MPTYKLYYFPFKGRGEVIRLIFAYAGVEYEDIRIPREEWPAEKDKMPYKQIPVLEVDGKKLCQTPAIVRYLAREFGLTGNSSAEYAKADEFAEAMLDIIQKLPLYEKDEEKKNELMNNALNNDIPPYLALVEANLAGEFYTGQLTYADFVFLHAVEFLINLKSDILDHTPKLMALHARILAIPNIAKWIERRPKTAM